MIDYISAVPVVRGKWRLYSPLTDTYECDKCGYQVIDESFRTNFCPNCGADMREDDNDRVALVKEAGFCCSYEVSAPECGACPAKEWCDRAKEEAEHETTDR